MKRPLPENLAVIDRIPSVLVDFAYGRLDDHEVLHRRPLPFSRFGLTAAEIASLASGDVDRRGEATGWDLGQRCYRHLARMVEAGDVARTPTGGSPVFYWPTPGFLAAHKAALDAMPPLTTTHGDPP